MDGVGRRVGLDQTLELNQIALADLDPRGSVFHERQLGYWNIWNKEESKSCKFEPIFNLKRRIMLLCFFESFVYFLVFLLLVKGTDGSNSTTA